MIEEIATLGLAVAMPLAGTTVDFRKVEPPPTAIYNYSGRGFDFNGIFLENIENKYTLMCPSENNTLLDQNDNDEKLLMIFAGKLAELTVDFDEDYSYFKFLSDLRDDEHKYVSFLYSALYSDDLKICNAISIFLSQKSFDYINADEENFILQILKNGDLGKQGYALQTILNWDNISNLNELKSVKIANRYLQEDLEDFISQKES